eukprot:3558168-Alexandrium_andersonii.AAC.1
MLAKEASTRSQHQSRITPPPLRNVRHARHHSPIVRAKRTLAPSFLPLPTRSEYHALACSSGPAWESAMTRPI